MKSFSWSSRLSEVAGIYWGLILCAVVSSTMSRCPEDVSSSAHQCFTEYSTQYQSVTRSHEKLCCGMHAEILRAFCSAYNQGISCVTALRYACPKESHGEIDRAMINLEGSTDALNDLCADDKIIELYAMHRRCFHEAKFGSQSCFYEYFNGSSIDFLTMVNMGNDQLCRNMKKTVHCVRDNIQRQCGTNAAILAPIFVKPMIRRSSLCNYSVITPKPKSTSRPSHGRPAYISEEVVDSHRTMNDDSSNNKNKNNDNNSQAVYRAPCHLVALTSIVAVVLSTCVLSPFFL